jgi:hypothetical protein
LGLVIVESQSFDLVDGRTNANEKADGLFGHQKILQKNNTRLKYSHFYLYDTLNEGIIRMFTRMFIKPIKVINQGSRPPILPSRVKPIEAEILWQITTGNEKHN